MCKAKSLLKAIGLRSGMGTHSFPEGVGGKDTIINVAMAPSFADIILGRKSQRTRAGGPARSVENLVDRLNGYSQVKNRPVGIAQLAGECSSVGLWLGD